MNISKSSKLIEHLKSALLVVLLLLTILLLSFFWGRPGFSNIVKEDLPGREAIPAAELLQPDHIDICFGGYSYTVIETGFQTIMDCFKAFSDSKNLTVEEIPRDRYLEIMKNPSIKAVFGYYVPFSAICEIYGIDRIPGADSIDAVSELGYAANYDDRLFVFDRGTNKYYRIIGSGNAVFGMLKNEIRDAEGDGAMYFTLENYMGGEVKNDTLCPFSFDSGIHDIPYSPEDFSVQPEKTGALVKGFFSDNFDFVRRIEQKNGTLIYMYGYGRIVVIAHNDGVLEFRMDDDERAQTQLRYLDAFERAAAFVAANGAFEAVDGTVFSPYLEEVVTDPNGKKGFRFIFGIKTDGARIYYQGGAPIVVDVTGGRVSYFNRRLIDIGPVESEGTDSREVFSAFNLLDGNFDYIKGIMDVALGENLSFEEIIKEVTRFDCGLVKTDNNSDTLTASWIVSIGNFEFYFGLDDGRPLGYHYK